ncbi:MAG: BREX-1 system adenine-specific DNA-methyltransferase PglX, partial [Alphaproteobacteria bacterium]|nr:BREX-1 system adenine-specific DNA-methyltransferase PglX [Alphaproteobacteria bacterium]
KSKYDVVIGNPPFGKIKERFLVQEYNSYKNNFYNKDTTNIFAMFLEKALLLGRHVSLITPKSLLASPEFNKTRELIENKYTIKSIIDFGEDAFDDVKIETIGISLENIKSIAYDIKIESYITQAVHYIPNSDLFDADFKSWLIYKDDFFKKVKKTMKCGVYSCFRDRTITKQITKPSGKIRVLKSRNIGDNEIVDIKDYDSFIDDVSGLAVRKYLNSNSILVPNLTYNPRACFMPKNCIADGSVAILQPLHSDIEITTKDLAYYGTDEFSKFYAIGRNLGTRSLNIDSNSVNLWGIKKKD